MFRSDDYESLFALFILSAFKDGPRSASEIRRRLQWTERLLYVAAKRQGRQGHGSVTAVLETLQRAGCLQVEHESDEQSTEKVYALTDSGTHRLEQERARQSSAVARFVEEADLDGSFKRFLDGNRY